uniref:Uncharacterized protein n=1 Tax=Bionectria ochroleuca TaxID=29856 RepID=A0A8H7N8C0_BIOOC
MAPTIARLAVAGLLLALQSMALVITLAILIFELVQRHVEYKACAAHVYAMEELQQPDAGEEEQQPDAEEEEQQPDTGENERHRQEAEPGRLPGHCRRIGVSFSARRSTFLNTLRLPDHFGIPAVLFVIAASFAVASFAPNYGNAISVVVPSSSTFNSTCQIPQVTTVDADIAGTGIRFATWAQIELMAALVLLGHFHVRCLGVKQLGAGLAITHLGLAVALAAQMIKGKLTSAEAIVGAMLLEGQGSALSIQLVAKDVLAARWQVWTSILCQTIGSAVLIICVTKFRAGDFVGHDGNCFCIKVFWWGWLTDCPKTTEAGEAAVFWVCLACRMVGSIKSALFAAWHTDQFHRAEKRRGLVRGIAFRLTKVPQPSLVPYQNPPISYSDCRATVTFSYGIHAVFSAMSMLAAQNAMSEGMEPSSGPVSVGQMNAVVVAVGTTSRVILLMIHWLYVICRRLAIGEHHFREPWGVYEERRIWFDIYLFLDRFDSFPIDPLFSFSSTTSVSIPSTSAALALTPSSSTAYAAIDRFAIGSRAQEPTPTGTECRHRLEEALLDRAARLVVTSKLTDTLEVRLAVSNHMIEEVVASNLVIQHYLRDPNRASATRSPNPNFEATEHEGLRRYFVRGTVFPKCQGLELDSGQSLDDFRNLHHADSRAAQPLGLA